MKKIIILSLCVIFTSGCGERMGNNTNQEIKSSEYFEKEAQNKKVDSVVDVKSYDSFEKDTEENYNKAGEYRYEVAQAGVKRHYLVHVPKDIKDEKVSLVLVFHGGMGNAEHMLKNYDWVAKSEKEGFIVVFPNGASRFSSGENATWNAGSCCAYAVKNKSDDVDFVKKIIKDVDGRYSINNNEIFATGMSNGGMFSHRLACEMSDTFKAVAAVAGTNNFDDCKPSTSISIMHIHSLKDDHVLFNGGCGPACAIKAETEFDSVENTVSNWAKRNKCSKKPEVVFENKNAYCNLYDKCSDDVKVKLCVTKDGGHSWPGLNIPANTSQAISATDEIWSFFESL